MPPRAQRRKATDPEALKLAVADLARSGLTLADAELLGFRALTPKETAALAPNFQPLPALYIPYWDPENPEAEQTVRPAWPPFYRLRYLAEPNGFNRVTGKFQKYAQPTGSSLCAYWCRAVDWRAVMADPTQPIIITEGEKKAAKTCIATGLPTIGLGGVSSWCSMNPPLWAPLLPDLARVDWRRRTVYIVYDSDARTNENVCRALWALAKELEYRGAVPFMGLLPALHEGAKTGLDDYLVAGGAIAEVLQDAEPITLARPLWDMNERVAYVCEPGLIIERATLMRMSVATFKDHRFTAENYIERRVQPTGAVEYERVNIGPAWLRWPARSEYAAITYLPGLGTDVTEGDRRLYNVWPGWGCTPKRGDASPFLALVNHLFTGSPEAERLWFLRWLAAPLQRPGLKLFTAAVVYGRAQGTGKSLIGFTLGRVYGKNFSEINQADLESGFNEWAQGKQFIMGDDVTGHDKRAHADQLKKMITQKELRVNQKYVPSYTIPDCLNYYFTTNQPDAFMLEDADRRYFVHEVTADPLPEEFYAQYDAWLNTPEGPAAVFDYLLNLDLGDFNPAAPALRTQAKANMTLDVKGDLAAWVHGLITDPDAVLRCGEVPLTEDLYTTRQLLTLYDPTGGTKVTANGLGRELRRAGVVHVLDGAQVRTAHGPERFYAVRNAARWRRATAEEVKQHVAGPKPKTPKY